MSDASIPNQSEDGFRVACLEMATVLNQMRETPLTEAAEVIADAQLFEHYISQGASIAFDCSDGMRVMIRGDG